MRFGLSPEQFALLDEIVIRPLKAAGAKVSIFGSRARGDHREFSDVDVLIEGDGIEGLLPAIRERIEESLFPYTVDLVEGPHVAASYATGIARDKIPV